MTLGLGLGLWLGLLACGGGGSGPDAPPPPPATAPVITAQPQPQAVSSGASATFTVGATGSGTLNYQWKRNGAEIPNANAASFSTGPTNVLDHGQTFAVVVGNSAGSVTSATVALTVNEPPVVLQQPTDLVLLEGQTATFSTQVQGTPPLVYQWRRNGAAIPGANGASYTIPSVLRTDDQARFSAQVSNGLGSVETRGALLQVGGLLTPPAITQQPTGMNVNIGQTATFIVAATGSDPLVYQWRRNGVALPGASAATFLIQDVQAVDAGAYTAVVSNGVGSATSQAATLIVNVVLPSITSQPVGVFVGTGQTATFAVGVAGSPPFAYQWQRNGVDIPGALANSYTTPPATLADNASTFAVKVTNPAGEVLSSPAVLRVFLARTVNGQAGVLKEGPTGQVSLPKDLRSADVGAFQQNAQGGTDRIPGLGAEDGTFTIPGVPPGGYLAFLDTKDGSPALGLWTTLDQLDFRTYRTGRSDASLSVVGQTSIKVQIQGSLPAPISRLELYSPTLSLIKPHTGPVYSWPWLGLPLFEASKDEVWIKAFKTTSEAFGSLSSLQAATKLPPFTLPDLGEKLLTVPMSGAASNQAYTFQADVPGYGNLLPLVNPSYQAPTGRGNFKMLLRGQVYGNEIGPILEWANILDLSTTQTGALNTGLLPYFDPYPAEWRRWLLLRQEFSLSLPVPGNAPVQVSDSIQEIWSLADLQPAPLVPRSVPVDQPRINGTSLFVPPASVGATPLITWLARAGATVSYYTVTVFEVDTATSSLVMRAEFATEAPSLFLPHGLLKAGTFYVLRINMVWAQNYNPLDPLRPASPTATAPVYSGVFKP